MDKIFFNTLTPEQKVAFAGVSKKMFDNLETVPQAKYQMRNNEKLEYVLQMIRSGLLRSDLTKEEEDVLFAALGPTWADILF